AQAGQGVIINRGVNFSRRSGAAGVDLAIVQLSPVQLRRHLPIEAAAKPRGEIRFASRFDVSSPLGASLWRCVQYVQNELISLDAGLEVLDNHVENLENFLIKTVLDTVGRDSSLAGELGSRNVLPGYLKKIISHMHAHCHEPIQLKDLCVIGNVSERTISAGIKHYMNASPIQYLKQLRLGHVHHELQRATAGTTVTDVAMHWGFKQLGWFSAEYRKQFGESPSETLRSAQLVSQ
ncbi:MAG: helix-turn-helix transcriptional regulator, partial [Gammaproteobacteria bacterium]|nr:helix-turn-helix transcriptional regulator [Gammaproteobacteria bacterium]